MDITDEIMKLINSFTRRELSRDEVYVFDIVLCDNEIDRDCERFTVKALGELKKLYVGKTGIFDHNPSGTNQTARIFRTELCTDETRRTRAGEVYTYLKAGAYMVRTESNADLIREIDGGIKKEVSVSCACSQKVCSVCGAKMKSKPCNHVKGRSYGAKTCHVILDGVTDVYEWSFVAVPAQPSAGVTKHFSEDGDASPAEKSMNAYRECLIRDIVRMGFLGGGETVSGVLERMELDELISVRENMAYRFEGECGLQLTARENACDVNSYKL